MCAQVRKHRELVYAVEHRLVTLDGAAGSALLFGPDALHPLYDFLLNSDARATTFISLQLIAPRPFANASAHVPPVEHMPAMRRGGASQAREPP